VDEVVELDEVDVLVEVDVEDELVVDVVVEVVVVVPLTKTPVAQVLPVSVSESGFGELFWQVTEQTCQ
jgi:hypothetical protein